MSKKVKSIRMEEEGLNILNEMCAVASKMYGARISTNSLLEVFIADGMVAYSRSLLMMTNNTPWVDTCVRNISQEKLHSVLEDLNQRAEGYSGYLMDELEKED